MSKGILHDIGILLAFDLFFIPVTLKKGMTCILKLDLDMISTFVRNKDHVRKRMDLRIIVLIDTQAHTGIIENIDSPSISCLDKRYTASALVIMCWLEKETLLLIIIGGGNVLQGSVCVS